MAATITTIALTIYFEDVMAVRDGLGFRIAGGRGDG